VIKSVCKNNILEHLAEKPVLFVHASSSEESVSVCHSLSLHIIRQTSHSSVACLWWRHLPATIQAMHQC